MRTRRLGTSDMDFSVIGFGSWALGGPEWQYGWGPQDDAVSIKAICHAVEVGVNWIDTAAVYGCGHSEEVVGKALKEVSAQPYVATKCGRFCTEEGPLASCLKYDSIKQECEDSLRRLNIEVIDLYQIHWPMPDEDIEEGWQAMADLKNEGKIRYAGVSNFSVEQMERIKDIMLPVSLQPPYSMVKRGIEAEILPYCKEHTIGVIVYSPLQKGLLTGKVTRERLAAMPENDHRRKDKMFTEPLLSKHLTLVEGLEQIAAETGHTCAQLVLAWTLRDEVVTSAITGTRKPAQIDDTAVAGDWELSSDIIDRIGQLLNNI